MAMSNRNERQLMRQRGAGSRNPSNVDFGFNFGAHGSREERQLMRQRGAGNRKIDNIDFGFSFPTPNQSRRPSIKTPRSIASASRTPQERRSSARNPSARLPSEQRKSQTPQAAQADSQYASAKRRKLVVEQENFAPQSSQRRRSSRKSFQIAEEEETNLHTSFAVVPSITVPHSPLFFPEEEEGSDKENQNASPAKAVLTPSVSHTLANSNIKRRVTRSSLDAVDESTVRSTEDGERSLHQEAENLTGTVEHTAGFELDAASQDSQTSHATSDARMESNASTLAEKPSKKRRKRKSVVQGRRRRRPSGNVLLTRQSGEGFQDDEDGEDVPERNRAELEGGETADLAAEVLTESTEETTILGTARETTDAEEVQQSPERSAWKSKADKRRQERKRRRGERRMMTSPDPQATDNLEEDGTYIDEEHSPEPPTPAPRRKTKTREQTDSHSRPTEARSKPKGSSFPILTHRLTNIDSLPTIIEVENEQADVLDQGEDSIHYQSAGMFTDRSAPNAVDVLAQICRETIETAMENLSSGGHPVAGRAELKRKRNALEAFGQDLDQRLFDMSEALETRLYLEARLRKVRRQKAELQAAWLEIRRERDMLALKADAIRRQNWESEGESKRRWEISELAQKMELDIDLEEQQNVENEEVEEGLEFMLRSIGGVVSNLGSSGGLLEYVKSFNKQLETIAASLEGR